MRLVLYIALLFLFFATPAQAAPWKKLGKVVAPTQKWEQGKTYEPTVIYRNGLYRMWYTGGSELGRSATGYAISRDGRHWRKKGIIVGLGYGGFDGSASRNSVVYRRGTYYLYFSDDMNLYVATSKDGEHFHTRPYPVLWASSAWWDDILANTCVWYEHGHWVMLYEARSRFFAAGGPTWMMALANGSTPFSFSPSAAIVDGLNLTTEGMWGGPQVIPEAGGYELYYHASTESNIPTDIYSAHSDDLVQWSERSTELVRSLSFEFDQVADPFVLRVGDRELMYYDGDNNPAGKAAIGLAVRAG